MLRKTRKREDEKVLERVESCVEVNLRVDMKGVFFGEGGIRKGLIEACLL